MKTQNHTTDKSEIECACPGALGEQFFFFLNFGKPLKMRLN